jgi:hypothetical protein
MRICTLVISLAVFFLGANAFAAGTAEIVKNWREGINYNNIYTLHRICRFARNAHGEYFYFMSEGTGQPFFKHVSQANAKTALGKKYIAPVSIRQ